MDVLLPELVRYIIPFLPLTTLIAARGVNKGWRSLALTAPLHPAREALLDLYLTAIVHPNFVNLVTTLQPHVREFDREAYIADLTSRGCVLPDLFELWILEWPSKAVHFWAWPGLPEVDVEDLTYHDYYYDLGNLLGDTTPIVDKIPVPKRENLKVNRSDMASLDTSTNRPTTYLAVALYQVYFWSATGVARLWLVVDGNPTVDDRDRWMGKLLWTFSDFVDGPEGPYTHGAKVIFYDTPFGPPMDFKLIDFLNLLDFSREQMDDVLDKYYNGSGPNQIDGEV